MTELQYQKARAMCEARRLNFFTAITVVLIIVFAFDIIRELPH